MKWRNALCLMAAVALVVLSTVATDAASGLPLRPTVLYPVKFGISPPMSSLKPVVPPAGLGNRERPNELHLFPTRPAVTDTVVQRQFGLSNMPAPITSFDGIPSTVDQTLFGFELTPPDTEGAVGGNSPASNVYFQWVNLAWAIFDKTTGAMIGSPHAGNSFWAGFGGTCQSSNSGDPIVLYDKLADRWFVAQFDVHAVPYHQCFAVSTSPDPLGTYYQYEYTTGSVFPDYPKYGIWSDAYLGTYNQFQFNTENSVGILALERAKMVAGDPTAAMIHIDQTGANWWSVLPADFDGTIAPPTGTAIFGEVAPAGTATGQMQPSFLIWNLTYDWTNPGAACFGAACSGQPNSIVPVAAYNDVCPGTRACVPMPSPGESVDAFSGNTMYRLQWRNTGNHENLVANHTVDGGGGVAGVRWYEMHRTSPADWTLYQQGTLAPADGLYRWMGSIAMDHSGDVALGYSGSSASRYPSVYYSGRLVGDPLGTLPQGEQQLVAGNQHRLQPVGRLQRHAGRPHGRLHLLVHPGVHGRRWFELVHPHRVVQVPELLSGRDVLHLRYHHGYEHWPWHGGVCDHRHARNLLQLVRRVHHHRSAERYLYGHTEQEWLQLRSCS